MRLAQPQEQEIVRRITFASGSGAGNVTGKLRGQVRNFDQHWQGNQLNCLLLCDLKSNDSDRIYAAIVAKLENAQLCSIQSGVHFSKSLFGYLPLPIR